MQNIERLQLYLNRKPYFGTWDYEQFLQENGLDPFVDYDVANEDEAYIEAEEKRSKAFQKRACQKEREPLS